MGASFGFSRETGTSFGGSKNLFGRSEIDASNKYYKDRYNEKRYDEKRYDKV